MPFDEVKWEEVCQHQTPSPESKVGAPQFMYDCKRTPTHRIVIREDGKVTRGSPMCEGHAQGGLVALRYVWPEAYLEHYTPVARRQALRAW